MSADERAERARRLLEGIGVTRAAVEAAGHEREIAAIRVSEEVWDAAMADRVRIAAAVAEAGFRYVALDLRPADEPS